jgi:two-component system LytT family response regulator
MSIELLRSRLKLLFPDITVAGTFSSWESGLEAVKSLKFDILFLDISMPEKTGIDFLKLLPEVNFQVIFITAHSDHAIQAIKFSPSGYVLKPIDDLELSFAVNKALDNIRKAGRDSSAILVATDNKPKIGVPNVKGVDYLNADDILYFESVNKYTKVVTKEFSIMSSYNLGEFKKIIDEDLFFQAHRSYIINMNKIKRYETSGMLIMDDNMQIPVSKNSKTDFLEKFSKISRTAGAKH